MKTVITNTIGRFTIEVKQGQFTPPDWPKYRNSVFQYHVIITPGTHKFTGRFGQVIYNHSSSFYCDRLDQAMEQYREFERFARQQPFVLVDDQLNPQYA
jgi:hypothetical protein